MADNDWSSQTQALTYPNICSHTYVSNITNSLKPLFIHLFPDLSYSGLNLFIIISL